MFRSATILELFPVLLGLTALASVQDSTYSPLHFAIRNGSPEAVRRLVDSGANVNQRDGVGNTPLMVAVFAGKVETTSYLLKQGADVNARQGQSGFTALRYAVGAGRADLVEPLLKAGARTDLRYSDRQTVLHVAASGRNVDCVKLLLASKADLRAVDANGNTPLDDAVLHGRVEIAATLLQNRADVGRTRPGDGRGVLHEACQKGYAPLIPVLLEAGADPALRDESGQTPLDLALDYKNRSAISMLARFMPRYPELQATFSEAMEAAVRRGRTEIIGMLLDAGLDVNRPTLAGSIYLNDAALKGQFRVVLLLLDRGARLDTRNQTGGTVLHDAAISGNLELIGLLLDRGCAIDAVDAESGATPLMLAASLGHTEAVALLLRRGANPALKDKSGRTALARAQEGQDADLVKLLQQAQGKASGRSEKRTS
jgi:ankyrin repeat protein